MASHGSVTLVWGDGEQIFNIAKIKQALELQDKCNSGVGTIMQRLMSGTFFINDFRETIRLGLIGGGMAPEKAFTLVKRYVDERPWKESVLVATAVISSAVVGIPDDPLSKKGGADQTTAEAETTASTTALSDPPSTAPVAQSDSPHAKSTS
jgi:hypothetical protein